ncbi:MAG: hypothetical protein ACK2U9_10620 [Anaerolineae bacterium]|jgi:hypothetical protein
MAKLIAALALAHVIAGEAGLCPPPAKVAIAYVDSRNAVMYGWQKPTTLDLGIALVWQDLADPSRGAFFALGPGDRRKLKGDLGVRTNRWQCTAGDFITTWRSKQ